MNGKVIIFASQQYGFYWSGLGSYSTWLIDEFAKHQRVYVLCPPSENRRVNANVHLIPVTPNEHDPTHGHWFSLSKAYAKRIIEISKDNEIAFIHFTDAREAFFSIRKLSNPLKRKIVGTLHDFYFAAFRCNPSFYRKRYLDGFRRWGYYFFVNRIENYTYKRIPYLIANTKYVKKTVAKAYGLDQNKINVIYIGLPEKWHHLGEALGAIERKDRQILFVGGNLQRKGIFHLARATQILSDKYKDLKIIVIGRDPNLYKVKAKIKKMGMDKYFDFKGYTPPEDLPKYYSESTILAMPAQIEAYGLVFLEALSCGCPVIGTAKGGTSELFKMTGSGMTVSPDDAAQIAREIEAVFEQKSGPAVDKIQIKGLIETVDETKRFLQDLIV